MRAVFKELKAILGYSDPDIYLPSGFRYDADLSRALYPQIGILAGAVSSHNSLPTFVRALSNGFMLALSIDHEDSMRRAAYFQKRFELRLIAPDGSILPGSQYEKAHSFFDAVNEYQISIADDYPEWTYTALARSSLLEILMAARYEARPPRLTDIFTKN